MPPLPIQRLNKIQSQTKGRKSTVECYDYAVIGLGPAGAVAARLLRGRVAAIDLKGETGGFEKPCGGLIAPDAQRALAALSLALPKQVLVDPQIFSVRTLDLDNGLERYYQRFYLNVDRHRFDRWLRDILPPAVTVIDGARVTSVCREDAGYRVNFIRPGGIEDSLRARVLIGADGAHSLVRRTFFPGRPQRTYLAIQEWFPAKDRAPVYSCILDRRITDCYSWSLTKDGSFLFGGAYPPRGGRAAFERQKAELTGRGDLPPGPALKREACLVARPRRQKDFVLGAGSVFLIGEAAGFVSPSSLEGISSAILSAEMLCRALEERNPQRAYRLATGKLRARLLLKNLKCWVIYTPGLRRLVLKTGFRALTPLTQKKE